MENEEAARERTLSGEAINTRSMTLKQGAKEQHDTIDNEEIVKDGFNTKALVATIVTVIILDIAIIYFGLGLLSLLKFFDSAVLNIYTLVQYVFYFAVFLLTYTQFTKGTGLNTDQQTEISTKTVRLWQYLNSGDKLKYNSATVESLHCAVRNLSFMLRICTSKDYPLKENANLKATECFKKATELLPALPNQTSHMASTTAVRQKLYEVAQHLQNALPKEHSKKIKIPILKQKVKIAKSELETIINSEHDLTDNEKKALKWLSEGITILRKTLIKILQCHNKLGIYSHRDKAEALSAALIFQKTTTYQPSEDNEHYLLLMKLSVLSKLHYNNVMHYIHKTLMYYNYYDCIYRIIMLYL